MCKKIILDPKVDLDRIAAMTTGFTGADLANLVNEAAVVATRRDSAQVTFEDVTDAIERIVAGLEKKSRILTPPERRRVAYHEMGHALVAASLPGVDPVLKVSIIPRGIGALGYTIQHPTEDRFVLAASELRNRIAVLMGGRAAEVSPLRRRHFNGRGRRSSTRDRYRHRNGDALRHGRDRRTANL